MDARRLGMGIGLPQAFLEAAAPGYLTDAEWDVLDEDWLEQALAYAAKPAKGVRGPLTRIRPHPATSRVTGPGSQDSDEQPTGSQVSIAGWPLYRLADYLDQHGRAHRKGNSPGRLLGRSGRPRLPRRPGRLGDAASARGLYRVATQLHKNAAACGNPHTVFWLANPPYYCYDVRPVRWATAHVPLDNPGVVADLLLYPLRASDMERVARDALLARDPTVQVSLDNPGAVARLLVMLREAGAQELAAALAKRAAAHLRPRRPARRV